MVVLYKTNLTFDTTKLLEQIPITSELIKVEKRGFPRKGESKRDKIKRRSKKAPPSITTGFCHNSITIVMLNDGDGLLPKKEITVKIFQNGVFHMTGVLHELYHTCSIRNLLSIVWECKESLKEVPDKYEIVNCRVVLMNYTTKLLSGKTVAREVLFNTIRGLHDPLIVCHYDPDVYPGVKIQVGEGKWTAKIFRTGKIILTGITTNTECTNFMIQLTDLFQKVL